MAEPIRRKPIPPSAQVLQPNNAQRHTSRTPSQGTATGSGPPGTTTFRTASQYQDRRSTSSRSGGPPTSYVALIRRQKATVWSDRAQYEDPRLLALQKAAKIRAALEITGGSTSSTGRANKGVTAKIRSHGKAEPVGYLVGGIGGVPMRLSASEVELGDSDEESGNAHYSSAVGRWNSSNTPPDSGSLHDLTETPVRDDPNYVPADSHLERTRSAGSGSSAERADAVGDLGSGDAPRLASNSLLQSTITREKSVRNPEELRRRGSVDERTMTMSAGRLYIANPDSDSD